MRTKLVLGMILAVLLTFAVACGSSEASEEQVVFPAVEPEAGSDEAAILSALDKWVRAIRTEDWEGYLAACDPTLNLLTVNQAEFVTDNIYGNLLDVSGLNARDVNIRVFDDDTATVEADFYGFEELGSPDTLYSWTKVAGNWHLISNCTLAG